MGRPLHGTRGSPTDLALTELAGILESLHALPDEHAHRTLLAKTGGLSTLLAKGTLFHSTIWIHLAQLSAARSGGALNACAMADHDEGIPIVELHLLATSCA